MLIMVGALLLGVSDFEQRISALYWSYRGGAPLLVDFFGNHIPVAATPVVPIIQQAELGTIVPLASHRRNGLRCNRLNEELRSFIASPETRQIFEKNALLSVDANPPTLAKRIVEELDYWKTLFKDKGARK